MSKLCVSKLLRARTEAVLWVGMQMAGHGITLTDLVAAGCFDDDEPERIGRRKHAIVAPTVSGGMELEKCLTGCNERSTLAKARSISASASGSVVEQASSGHG